MPTQRIDPKVIFASDAPAIDKPPVFSDKTKGWDVARLNDGRPTIKEMNKVQQDTDLKILWLNENSVTPYDESIDYPDGAVAIKDGSFKQLLSGAWVEFLDGFANKDEVKRGIANRYDPSLIYNSGERVILTNGDIVKSTVPNNIIDPNVDMTGWVNTNSASQIFNKNGDNQQEINDRLSYMTYMRLHVSYFGVVGDGVVDDTAALKAAISFVETNGLAYLDTTDMKMLCSETINIGKPMVFGGQNSAIVGNHTNTILKCYPTTPNKNFYNEANNKNLELNIGALRTAYTDVPSARGIEVWNCHGGILKIQTLKNHYDALYLSADAEQGLTYCEVWLGKITNCSGGLVLVDTHSNPSGNRGWVTENTFYGGSFSSSDSTVKPYVRYHVDIRGTLTGWNNHNVFIRPSFEGWMKNAILLKDTMANIFISPRFEMPELSNMYITSGTSKGNRIIDGFGIADFISENKYTDTLNAMAVDGFSWVGNKSRSFNFVSNTVYEHVADDETQFFTNTATRKHATVGRKSVKNITHSAAGALTLNLTDADVFLIDVGADISSITLSNAELLTTQQEKTIVFTQSVSANITGLTAAQLGNFAMPSARLNGTDTYILRKTRQGSSATVAVTSHHTNTPVNDKTVLTVAHSASGVLNLDLSQAKRFYIRVNADITSLTFSNIASASQLDIIRVFFRQDVASNITIPAAYLSDKSNPVNRANGYDVYDFVKLFASANDGFKAISQSK